MLGIVLVCLGGLGAGAASAAPRGDAQGQLTFGGLQRTYRVHAPGGGDRPAGLVINMHGSGASGGAQEALSNYDPVADALGLVVAYPDGVDESWADGRGSSPADRRGVDDVGFLVALVDRLIRDYDVEPGRVFATGISAGAFMANRLACDRADVIAAIAPVAGTLGTNVAWQPVATGVGSPVTRDVRSGGSVRRWHHGWPWRSQ